MCIGPIWSVPVLPLFTLVHQIATMIATLIRNTAPLGCPLPSASLGCVAVQRIRGKYDKFKILRDSTYYVCAGCGRVWQALRDGTRMGTRHAAKCYRCCSRALEAGGWLPSGFWLYMQDLFPGSIGCSRLCLCRSWCRSGELVQLQDRTGLREDRGVHSIVCGLRLAWSVHMNNMLHHMSILNVEDGLRAFRRPKAEPLPSDAISALCGRDRSGVEVVGGRERCHR